MVANRDQNARGGGICTLESGKVKKMFGLNVIILMGESGMLRGGVAVNLPHCMKNAWLRIVKFVCKILLHALE